MGLLLMCLTPVFGQASMMQWADLLYQMKGQVSWSGMEIQTQVQVFDPTRSEQDAKGNPLPVEVPARSYTQTIHWQDNGVLLVETFDASGTLVHLWWEHHGEQLEWSGKPGFTHEEVRWPWLEFASRHPDIREHALREWGVESLQVSQELDEQEDAFYRVGHPDSGAYAWIDPKTFQLHALRRPWTVPQGSWLQEVRFEEFKSYRQQEYPSVTEFRLNGKLYKRLTVTKAQRLGDLAIGTLRERVLQKSIRPQAQTWRDDAS